MLYVGLTEDHRESATMFANVVGAQVISQLRGSSSDVQTAATNKLGTCGAIITVSSLEVRFVGSYELVLLNMVE